MNDRYQEDTPPVSEGDTVDVKIESVGAKGDGLAKISGFVLFIPGVKEGDNVKVKVTRVLSKVGFAEVVGEASESVESEQAEPVEPQEEPAEEPEAEEDIPDTEDFGEELEEEK